MGDRLIPMGEIVGVHGVQGWVKVVSHTDPRERILEYQPWQVKPPGQDWREVELSGGRRQGNKVLAQVAGVTDPEAAQSLVDATIAVYRHQLPEPSENEYYWTDLEGMRVVNAQDVDLGVVAGLTRTGANDVMVVTGAREYWVPFVLNEYVQAVDFDNRVIRVDWDPAF